MVLNVENKQRILTPYYLKRIGGVPLDKIIGLTASNTVTLIRDTLQIEQQLDNIKDDLFHLIFLKVEAEKNPLIRKKLIAIKKNVYKFKEIDLDCVETEGVPLNIIKFVNKWNVRLRKLKRMQELYPVIYKEELYRIRKDFQEVVKNENLLNGIVLTSQSMYEKTIQYTTTPIDEQKSRLRKIEPSLAIFLIRAACKTSPFSTFTSTLVEEWDGKENQIGNQEIRKSFVKINYTLVMRIFDHLLLHNDVMPFCTYHLNSTVSEDNNVISYIINEDKVDKTSKVFRSNEKLININNNPLIKKIVELLKEEECLTYNQLFLYVNKIFNSSTKTHSFIKKLNQIQLILPNVCLDQQSENIIEECISKMASFDVGVVRKVCASLSEINKFILLYSDASTNQRNIILSKIKNIIIEIAQFLQVDFPKKLINNIIYEDSILYKNSAEKKEDWEITLNNIELLQKISPIFDIRFRYQSAVAELFIEKYGEKGVCNNVEEFLTLLKPLFDEYLRTLIPGYEPKFGENLAHIKKINKLKKSFMDEFISPTNNGNNVCINKKDIERYYKEIPQELKSRTSSHSFFVQKTRGENSLAIINQVYIGYTEFFTRFLNYYQKSYINSLKRHLKEKVFDNDGVTIELSSSMGFNANLHPAMGEYELEMSDFPLARQTCNSIKINDLSLVFDKNTKRLVLRHNKIGKINPFYIGYLTPFYLPSLQKYLTHIFQSGYIGLPFHIYNELNLPPEEKLSIRKYGRITIGNVVIQRKKWVIPRQRFLELEANMSEMQYFYNIQKWILENDLPTKFFFKMVPLEYKDLVKSQDDDNYENTDAKPLYMDLSNPIFVKVFRKLTTTIKYGLLIEEVLPDLGEYIDNSEQENYVEEYILELTQKVCKGI
ncbi:lantibiotic dehydratase [Bacillus wiedmannii]|uniref:lantibiotic dehydratase n=1 Tax=Bacillus wiedmannii TaxID=1890302 RepID=UPI003CF5C435